MIAQDVIPRKRQSCGGAEHYVSDSPPETVNRCGCIVNMPLCRRCESLSDA